jgi:hypothetical protein
VSRPGRRSISAPTSRCWRSNGADLAALAKVAAPTLILDGEVCVFDANVSGPGVDAVERLLDED